MNPKITKAIMAGIVATAAMTVFMYLAPMLGMPRMIVPEMLMAEMHIPIAAAWIIHFMIGIVFAMAYAILFANLLRKINSKILKGVLFGIIVFILAQIGFGVMGAVFGPLPSPGGSMVLVMAGAIINHLIYGIVVVFLF